MIIDTKSWHYKLWAWSYNDNYQVPSTTNFCSYMRRLMFLVPGKAVLLGIYGLLYGLLLLFPVATIRLMFGYKTVSLDIAREGKEYSGLPIAGRQIYPWHVIILGFFLMVEAILISKTGWLVSGLVNASSLGITALGIFLMWFFTNDSTQVLRDWVVTKKRKICPIVEFGDSYQSELEDEDSAVESSESEQTAVDASDTPMVTTDKR